jgi:hypothetical protein
MERSDYVTLRSGREIGDFLKEVHREVASELSSERKRG